MCQLCLPVSSILPPTHTHTNNAGYNSHQLPQSHNDRQKSPLQGSSYAHALVPGVSTSNAHDLFAHMQRKNRRRQAAHCRTNVSDGLPLCGHAHPPCAKTTRYFGTTEELKACASTTFTVTNEQLHRQQPQKNANPVKKKQQKTARKSAQFYLWLSILGHIWQGIRKGKEGTWAD